MPELIEVEYYRSALVRVVGQRLRSMTVTPGDYVRPRATPTSVFGALLGLQLTDVRRHGKLLLLGLGDEGGMVSEVGLRFGMTGRLLIDGTGPIDYLEYSSRRDDPAWDRVVMNFDVPVAIRDQRRLGSIELAPDVSALGIDALALDDRGWSEICRGRRKSTKAVLLDQSLVAGIGNLLADEILWRSCIDPARPARSLSTSEVTRLATTVGPTIAELMDRGGSHRGDSFALRECGAICTHCGHAMEHTTVATRSTWWCRGHQL